VAEALTAAGWLQYASTSRDEPFVVPGLTLTSFHLQQLRALRLVNPRNTAALHCITPPLTCSNAWRTTPLRKCRRSQLLPSVRLGWLVHDIPAEVLAEAAAAGVHQLCPRANIVSQAEVAEALQAGFSVRGWGIKDTEVATPDRLSCAKATDTLPRATT
jgi:hypothetical protein